MKVYTLNVCGKCRLVKSNLDVKGISYEEINMDQNQEALTRMQNEGIQAAPIVEDSEGKLHFDLPEILAFIDGL